MAPADSPPLQKPAPLPVSGPLSIPVPPAGSPPFHKPGPVEVSGPFGAPGSATAIGAKPIAAPVAAVATTIVVRYRIFVFIVVSPVLPGGQVWLFPTMRPRRGDVVTAGTRLKYP